MVHKTKIAVNFLLLSACLLLLIGCGKGKKNPTIAIDSDLIPQMRSEDVTMLVSDSGIARYRAQVKVWEIFSEIQEPYNYFPEGFYVEQFDSLFNVSVKIKSDTAYYFEKKDLWHLIGNVFIQNAQGTTVKTSEIFWDQKADPNSLNSIYTDKFVEINENGRIIQNHGLRANQSLTRHRTYDMSGQIPHSERIETRDSINSSTIQSDNNSTNNSETHIEILEENRIKKDTVSLKEEFE